MQFLGRGTKKENGDGNEFRNSMQEAAKTAQTKVLMEKLGAFIGSIIGFSFTLFAVPFLIVYAYNGLQPAVWPDISYLPTLVGLFVFRVLLNMVRSE